MRIEVTQAQRDALAAFAPHPELMAIVEAFDAARIELEVENGAIARARAIAGDKGVEIDAEPAVSVGEDGVWVAAWLLVDPDD